MPQHLLESYNTLISIVEDCATSRTKGARKEDFSSLWRPIDMDKIKPALPKFNTVPGSNRITAHTLEQSRCIDGYTQEYI